MKARRWQSVAVLAAVTALLAGFASGAEAKTEVAGAAAEPYKVGIVYSRTGASSPPTAPSTSRASATGSRTRPRAPTG